MQPACPPPKSLILPTIFTTSKSRKNGTLPSKIKTSQAIRSLDILEQFPLASWAWGKNAPRLSQ